MQESRFAPGFLLGGWLAAAAAGDVAAGKTIFQCCGFCHSVTKDNNGIGPSLWGVVGRKTASASYPSSASMQKYGVTWNEQSLNAFRRAPMRAVEGTKMTYAGLTNSVDHANVIACLQKLHD